MDNFPFPCGADMQKVIKNFHYFLGVKSALIQRNQSHEKSQFLFPSATNRTYAPLKAPEKVNSQANGFNSPIRLGNPQWPPLTCEMATFATKMAITSLWE